MFRIILCAVVSCYVSNSNPDEAITAESVLTRRETDQWTMRVVRNTIMEHRPVVVEQTSEHGTTVRGGDLRTDILLLVVTRQAPDRGPVVAWTQSESRIILNGEYYGYLRPTVMDVAHRGDAIFILHIAQSEHRLTMIECGPQPGSEWRTSWTFTLDLSSLAARGQESVGLKGQIVQVNGKMYLYFSHVSIPGVVLFRVDDDNVSIETDSSVVRDVTEAVATESDTPPSSRGSPATQPE